jgi:hypothetical protein
MQPAVIRLLGAYFDEELAGSRPRLRNSLTNAPAGGEEKVRAEFQTLLSERTLTAEEFRKATRAEFDSDEEMYAAFEQAYRFFFENGAAGGQ